MKKAKVIGESAVARRDYTGDSDTLPTLGINMERLREASVARGGGQVRYKSKEARHVLPGAGSPGSGI